MPGYGYQVRVCVLAYAQYEGIQTIQLCEWFDPDTTEEEIYQWAEERLDELIGNQYEGGKLIGTTDMYLLSLGPMLGITGRPGVEF